MTNPADSDTAAIEELPGIPRDDDGPVFAEPWQAQAFAMTLRLHANGVFTWKEWTEALGAEIAAARDSAARDSGELDDGRDYYRHWLSALEKIVAAKGILEPGDMASRADAWDRAARATPHGEPIVLGRDAATGE